MSNVEALELPVLDIPTTLGADLPMFVIKANAEIELADAKRDPDAFERSHVRRARSELDRWSKSDGEEQRALLLFNLGVRVWALGAAQGGAIAAAAESGAMFAEAAASSADERLVAEATYNRGICLMGQSVGVPGLAGLEEISTVFLAAAEALASLGDREWSAYARANAGFALAHKATAAQGTEGEKSLTAAADAFGSAAEGAAGCGRHSFAAKCLVNRSAILLNWWERVPDQVRLWREGVDALESASEAYVRAWDRAGFAVARDRLAWVLVKQGSKVRSKALLRRAEQVSQDAEHALRAVGEEEQAKRAARRTRNALIIRTIAEREADDDDASRKHAEQKVAAARSSEEERARMLRLSARARNDAVRALTKLGIESAERASGERCVAADLVEAEWGQFQELARAFWPALIEAVRSEDKDRASTASHACLLLRGEMHLAAANLTSAVETCDEEGSATRTRTEEIGQEVGAARGATLSSQFEEKAAALAVARTQALDALEASADLSLEDVERVLLPEVREATITRVQSLIEQAQQEPPEDKVAFVRVVRRLLCAADLELRAVGSSAKTTLTMKGSSLGLSVSGRGSVGFAGVPVEVVRATPPEFAPRPSRSKTAPSPKPS